MEFNPSLDIRAALLAAASEKIRVDVHLRGASQLSGLVAGVGDHFVVLSKLTGKDFSDAMVKLDSIVAVVAQVRKA